MNLVDALKDQVTGVIASKAASFLGESESGVTSALNGIFPTLLSKVIGMSESSGGAEKLFKMAQNADPGILENMGDLFGSSKNVTNLMNGGSGILSAVLGDNIGGIIETISKVGGLKTGSSSSLMKMAAPFLMSMVGRYVKNKALDAVGLGKFLGTQKQSALGGLPSGIGSLLGLSGLADAGKNIVGGATDAGKKVVGGAANLAGDAVGGAKKVVGGAANMAGDAVDAGAKAGGSILKWLLPLFLIALLASYFGFRTGCSAVDSAVDSTKGGIETVGDVAGDAAKGAAGAVGDAAGAMADGVGNLFGNINEKAKMALDKITFSAGSAGEQMMKYIDGGFKGEGKFRFNNLTFNTGSAAISGTTASEVDNLAAILAAYPDVKVHINGYTDNTGDANKNISLSKARAASVQGRLIAQGIDAGRISTEGHGAANPVASNDTPEGRAENRRIEVLIAK